MCGQLETAHGGGSNSPPNKITTVIVDDSPFMQEGIAQLLRRIDGVELRATASDGVEGLNLALATCPDLVLMDFQMPNMDGLTAARLIREAHPGIKIILITAHDLEAVRRNAFVSWVDGVLCKQQLPSQLVKTIRAIFADRFVERNGKEEFE